MPKTNAEKPSIREARLDAGLTQAQLADLSRCSLAYVRVIERGYIPTHASSSPAFNRILETLDLGDGGRS